MKGDYFKLSIRMRLSLMLVIGVLLPFMLVNIIRPLYNSKDVISDFNDDYSEFLETYEVEETLKSTVDIIDKAYESNPLIAYDVCFYKKIDESLSKQLIFIIVESENMGNIFGPETNYEALEVFEINDSIRTEHIDLQLSSYQVYILGRATLNIDTDKINIRFLTGFPVESDAKMRLAYQDIMMLFTVFSSVYVALVVWVSRSIHKPLNRLQHATERFSQGDYSIRIGDYTNDKIGEVSKAFDHMCDEAEEANQLKEKYEQNRRTMIVSISHDLKTPLTAIKVNVDAINDGVVQTKEERAEAVSVIVGKLDYMQYLIEELFLYSKLDMNTEQFHFRDVPLNRFIEDVVEEWEMDYSIDNMEIHLEYEKNEAYSVSIDVEKMKRVIENILGNAVKYADIEKLIIHIKMFKGPSYYELSISDNGVGVSVEEAAHLFDRFYRVDDSRNNEIEGSGLGLAIARRIIDNHEGKITAESTVNKGLTILIQLPFERREI